MTKADDTEIKQSLADRLRALKTNQENWKNRINKTNDLEIKNCLFKKRFSIDEDLLMRRNDEQNEKTINKFGPKPPAPSTKLADRMLSLEKSAAKWRNRVADKDNQKFTISGKMASIDYVANKANNSNNSNISNNSNNSNISNNSNNSNISNNSKLEKPKPDAKIELTKRDYSNESKLSLTKKKELTSETRKSEVPAKNESKPVVEPAAKRESIFRSGATKGYSAVRNGVKPADSRVSESITIPTATPTGTPKATPTAIPTAEPRRSIDLPRLDADFDTFFKPVKLEKVASSPEKEKDDFFSQISELDHSGSNLLVIKKNVKPRNRKATTGNPLKKRNSSDFMQDSFSNELSADLPSGSPMETSSTTRLESNGSTNRFDSNSTTTSSTTNNSTAFNSATHSTLHKQTAAGSHQPTKSAISSTIRKDLDPTAKAGLESKEDYKSVASKLKKSADINQEQHLDANNLQPNKKAPKCLIQVKGRKKLQVRLVEPVGRSINEGDSYVLITSNLVVAWIGRFSNIIERTRVLEVASKIHKRKELGFVGGKLITIDNDKKTSVNADDVAAFESCLASSTCRFSPAGDEDEDEAYESQAVKSDRVYILDQERCAFKLCDQMCGKQLYQQQLNPYEAFLFDFGAEVYVWLGFHLSNDCRNTAIELAGELFAATADRPEHAILYKCNQNMELILFQEKFFDWVPNYKLGARAKNSANDEFEKRMNLKVFDVNEMLKPIEPVDFVLDNTSIGRGDFYHDENELLYIEVVTDNVRCWHINEHEKRVVRSQDLGQFSDTETYVVRWQYRINRLGNLENTKYADRLKSIKSRKPAEKQEENIFKRAERVNFRKHKEMLDSNVTGRERFCYFYWQGLNGSVASKTAAALMTIELADKEKSTQIQVRQTEEPPCFLRLFKGKFVVYNERYQDQATRLFLVKGVCSEEAFLYEVRCDAGSLRSKGCFVLVNFKLKNAYLWIGKCTSAEQAKVAADAAQNINKHGFSLMSRGSCLGSSSFIITTIKQSLETAEFLSYLGASSTQQAKSTIRSLVAYEAPENELAIFHLSSTMSGEFFFKRLACTYSSEDVVNNFPFEQRQLYSLGQPTFFLVDNGQTVWLWQGHFPNNDDNVLTGSITIRYSQEKKCALETVLSYCHEKYQNKPIDAYLIHAGLEPDSFIQLFPEWTVDEEVKEIQLKDGKKEGEMNPVREVLARVCNSKNDYKLEDLRKKPLPDGINPLIIESYLSDGEFHEVFGMNKTNFYSLPNWKQRELKQTAGLF